MLYIRLFLDSNADVDEAALIYEKLGPAIQVDYQNLLPGNGRDIVVEMEIDIAADGTFELTGDSIFGADASGRAL